MSFFYDVLKFVRTSVKKRSYLFFIFLILMPSQVFAEDLNFSVPENEQTYIYLKQIFGNVPGAIECLDGNCGGVVPQLFDILNKAIMMVGAMIISYVLFVTTAVTASEGEFLGRRYSSFWLPIRSIVGVGILVPVSSQGYSTLQIVLMKFILFGVGTANLIYNKIDIVGSQFSISTSSYAIDATLTSESETNTAKTPITLAEAQNLTKSTFAAFLAHLEIASKGTIELKELIKNLEDNKDEAFKVEEVGKKLTYQFNTVSIPGGYKDYKVTFTANNSNDLLNQLKVDFGADPTSIYNGLGFFGQIFAQASAYAELYFVNQEKPFDINIEKKEFLQSAGIILDGIARNISAASQTYYGIASNAGDDSKPGVIIPSWLSVPSRYYDWVKVDKVKEIVDPVDVEVPDLQELGNDKFYKEKVLTFVTVESSGSDVPSGSPSDFYPKYTELQEKGAPFLKQILLDPGDKSDDPILVLADKARDFFNSQATLLFGLVPTAMVAVAIGGVCGAVNPTSVSLLTALAGLLIGFAQFLLLALPVAISLGLYLPLMPLLIYNLSVIAWFMQVIEAMVAAPIITLGLLAPSQEGLGKATPSLMLILNIVIRPPLMLLGLVLGAKLFAIFAYYLSEVIAGAYLVLDGHLMSWIIDWVWILIYVSALLSVAQKCFSLIHIIPDRALVWIGGQALDSRDIGQDMAEIKSAASKGEEAVKGLATLAGSSVKSLGQYGKEGAERKAAEKRQEDK